MTSLFIPLGLAFIMLTVGLGLAPADFRALARRPQVVLAGVAAQILFLPLAALAVAMAFGLAPLAALGLVLVACVPGGVTSNFITLLARGDAALSVVMTATSTTAAVLTVPFVLAVAVEVLAAGVGSPAVLPVAATSRAVLVVTVLPMALGMTLRALRPALARRLRRPARRLATVLFLAIVAVAFARDWSVVEAHWRSVGPAVVAFNVLAVAGGLTLGRILRAGPRASVTLGIECGLQNVALALFLGASVLGAPALMVPAVIYVLVMNASALVLVALGRRLAAPVPGLAPRP